MSAKPDVYELRRQNLRKLIADTSAANVARILGYSNASYLSQLTGPNPGRTINEKTARSMEQKLNLPAGWMDGETHIAATVSQVLDTTLLSNCMQAVQMCIEGTGKSASASTIAELVSLVYEHSKALNGKYDEGFVRRLVNLTVK